MEGIYWIKIKRTGAITVAGSYRDREGRLMWRPVNQSTHLTPDHVELLREVPPYE